MCAPPSPPEKLLQQVWDDAARMAQRGVALGEIVSKAVVTSGPQVDAELVLAIPSRGRTFWASLGKALAWGAAAEFSLLVIGSLGARPVPVLKFAIFGGVLIWAVAFGVMAGNHRVRDRRSSIGAARLAEVERVARDAAGHVWETQVPGKWHPLGPAVDTALDVDQAAPAAWLRRFGVAADDAIGSLVDGTAQSLRDRVRAGRGTPVVLFVRDPGVYTDEARSMADVYGVALFVAGRQGLHAMSHVASLVLRAYQNPASTEGPVRVLLAEWSAAATGRSHP